MNSGVPPKGISVITLNRVIGVVEQSAGDAVTAADVAASTGMSAVTARRYLRFLAASGRASVSCRYGRVGAPERLYRLRAPRPQRLKNEAEAR
jgi:response regulator of citrate/malate metabolism